MAEHERCPFCHVPRECLKSSTYIDHITECRDFNRKYLDECPFGKECDANVESHFMRYNHTFEDRATFILLSPVKPKKRKWNLSRTPTKSPRTSRTPVKSPRTPRLATPNKPSNKKLKTTQTPSTSKQHASHNNFTECTSSTLDESQPVKDESKLNATRKSLFITVSSDEEEQGNGKEVLEQGATGDHPVAPKEENIVIECSPDIPNECSPPESKSQLEKNDTEFSDQNIPEECFPPDGNPLLDIDNDNFFNQHDEKQKENSLPNGSKPREKVQKTITFFFGSNTSSHPPQNLPEKPPAGCKPGPTSARRFNGTRSYNSTPSSSGSSLSQGPQQSKSREQQNSSEKRCPFYKKIKNTSIAVDAFSYGSIPGIKFYFLTHFHSDHYCGLTRKFPHQVYCSQVTANLVRLKIKLPDTQICSIPLNEPVAIDNATVTLLDANHCPGSVMLLLELPDGSRYLHTGDFRATSQMSTDVGRVDLLYLDNTYCDPMYTFPPQDKILAYVENLVWKALESCSKTLFLCGSYLIGKERLFLAVAEALDSKIWASTDKQRVLRCQDNPFISDRLVENAGDAAVHVVFMGQLNYKYLQQHLHDFSDKYDQLVAFKPTGWEYNSSSTLEDLKPRKWGRVLLYGVPYSEHSSFEELKRFVHSVRPNQVITTVPHNQRNTQAILKSWLKS